jgi:superfamily II DNA or RNA helicase
MELELRPAQQQVVADISAAFRAGYKRVMVSAACGFGKCHGKGTKVIMADGSVKAVEDVDVGDRLLSPTGLPRTVLSLGRGREEMYRVVPVKGDSYTVNSSHLLSCKISGTDNITLSDGRTFAGRSTITLDVPTYLGSNKTARSRLKGWKPKRVDFDAPPDDLLVPPYILGAWLGDGRATGPEITKPPCKMVDEWIKWGESMGCTAHQSTTNGTRCLVTRLTTAKGAYNAVSSRFTMEGVFRNKHIPTSYLTSSYEARLELLAGLLDSDGHHAAGGYDWISKDETMARQFAFLCRSLGFACYLTHVRKGIKSIGFSAMYWRCTVSGDCERIPCRDKPARPRIINKDHLVTGISSIDPLGVDDYYGFELDGDHLYMLEDFTVCHNTELATAILQAAKSNNKRSAFLADRISLCTQTSERFDKYGLDHGMMQASHWRCRPSELVQVCSVQTLARRRWPEVSLIVVDEAHVLNEAVKKKLASKDCYAIGLSATAVTPGLGKYFDVVVNAPPTNRLIEQGLLVPLRYFACTAPDMTDVKVVAGEWDAKETDKKTLQVVGDVVKEYLLNGQGKKFIGFASSIVHAQELQRQFLANGINVATYTADDKPEDRSEIVQEFKKEDSSIRGILSVEALTRGFDVASVEVLILARPLRQSLAVHVQMLGRVMRTSEGKTEAIVLDHSGNVARFWNACNELFENGVTELDDGKKKEKPKAKDQDEEKEMVKCPQCRAMHMPRPSCPCCGHEYPRKKAIEHVPGTLKELVATGNPTLMKKMLWPQVCALVLETTPDFDRAQRRAQAIYHELTGTFAMGRVETTTPEAPTPELRNKVKANQIRFIKGKQAAARYQEAVAA